MISHYSFLSFLLLRRLSKVVNDTVILPEDGKQNEFRKRFECEVKRES